MVDQDKDFDARAAMDELLDQAVVAGASDVHLEPAGDSLEARFRVDGLLSTVQKVPASAGRALVQRLMVMAQLLTYRLDIPQEGRATVVTKSSKTPMDLRVSVMPTTHGLRAAVRLPAELVAKRSLDELELPPSVTDGLKRFARTDTGMLILTGPAGSGKTTTIYALLEHIRQTSEGLSIVALEDPVERDLPGVTQIEVSPFGELTYERALRSILRQDPQVLMLGEIRDAATASIAVQAALSGHRLISTLHAGTPAGAIARLMEMGVEPYQITSALFGVVSQRLVRKKSGEKYSGRVALGEYVQMEETLRKAVLARADLQELAQAYEKQPGFVRMKDVAEQLVRDGLTDDAEIRRVLGIGDRS
ncbi:MAG TPA: ATPase, T2SS/T4P/T4SS family [Tepidisphaeraceae bacterium]|jgi:type II secretory ATPase GspE/PulE/Tfp pilus assembly ATPase PilB-like protein